MSINRMNSIFRQAKENKHIIPAFNAGNLDILLAIVNGIGETPYSGIIQISPSGLKIFGFDYISQMFNLATVGMGQKVFLHLDHGDSYETVVMAVEAGFDSIMIDGSQLPFEENIKLTKKVVNYCHERDIPVEAELGVISGKEDNIVSKTGIYTDPDIVEEFCIRTNCDTLAISVGNIHGLSGNGEIDFNLLNSIKNKTYTPLVIHGGSGIPDKTLRELRKYGVVKINFSSELKRAYISTVGKRYIRDNNEHNIVSVLEEARQNVKNIVINKLLVLNNQVS